MDPLRQSEGSIEAWFVKQIKQLGGEAYKFSSPSRTGVPDRLVVLKDRWPFFVEFKTEDGTLAKRQAVEIKRLLDLGQTAVVCKGMAGAKELLNLIKKDVTSGTGSIQF